MSQVNDHANGGVGEAGQEVDPGLRVAVGLDLDVRSEDLESTRHYMPATATARPPEVGGVTILLPPPGERRHA